jgi:hypothetical protein
VDQSKGTVRGYNVTADLPLHKLLQTTNDAIGQVTLEDWKGPCQCMVSVEKQCWEMDGIVPDVIVPTVAVRGALLLVRIQTEEVSHPLEVSSKYVLK